MDIEKPLESKSRRNFLKKSATNIVTLTAASVGGIIAANPFPSICLGGVISGLINNNSGPEENSCTYTNNEHIIDSTIYRNLGVSHTKEEFEKNKLTIIEAIKSSDIILLEEGGYFDNIAKICKENNKTVYYIDNHSSINIATSFYCTLIGPTIIFENVLEHKELQTLEGLKNQSRRNFLAAILSLNSFIATYPFLYGERKKLSYEGQYDISYIVDGRTVFMLGNIFNLIKQHKGKRFLSITGDVHAKGFEYYIENQDAFNLRKKIYSNTYGLFSSNKPKKAK